MAKKKDGLDEFLNCSALVTGFGRLDLLGTGMAETYYRTLTGTIGESICDELWAAIGKLQRKFGGDPERLEEAITKELVIGNPKQGPVKLGPVIKAIVQMWYLGQWAQMPPAWRAAYGTNPNDFNRIVSAEAYTEGLIWRAAGTHPQGARQPGYGSWAQPPVQIAAAEPQPTKKAATGE
jgi:hypothetical protein